MDFVGVLRTCMYVCVSDDGLCDVRVINYVCVNATVFKYISTNIIN